MSTILARVLTVVLAVSTARTDGAPIYGTVKALDVGAQTLTFEVASNGKTRVVIVYMKPQAKAARWPLSVVKAGWTTIVLER